LDFFRELGLTILGRWRQVNYDEEAFPSLASAALAERPPSASVDPMDVVRWVHETPVLVPQSDITAKFGEPPISVFDCEQFYIQVLFWVDGTTTVHQHAFSGAFHVMAGSSIHSTFRFQPHGQQSARLSMGALELTDVEMLARGDVRPIVAGPKFVHALFHCDRPTVSIVVRTRDQASAGPQFEYLRSGLAHAPAALDPATARRIQTLQLLEAVGDAGFERRAREMIVQGDAFLAFQVLQHLSKALGPRLLAFLEGIRPAHGELLDVLVQHARERRREERIVSLRRLVPQTELRFFLALLLNVSDRKRLLALVERAFPGHPATSTVTHWLAALSKPDAILEWASALTEGPSSPRPRSSLDKPFDKLSLRVTPYVLDGSTDEQIVERLRSEAQQGSTPSEESIARSCQEVRRSDLLRALFT
jgi:hypothetical protein